MFVAPHLRDCNQRFPITKAPTAQVVHELAQSQVERPASVPPPHNYNSPLGVAHHMRPPRRHALGTQPGIKRRRLGRHRFHARQGRHARQCARRQARLQLELRKGHHFPWELQERGGWVLVDRRGFGIQRLRAHAHVLSNAASPPSQINCAGGRGSMSPTIPVAHPDERQCRRQRRVVHVAPQRRDVLMCCGQAVPDAATCVAAAAAAVGLCQ